MWPGNGDAGYLDFLDPFLAFLAGFLVPLAAGDFLSAGIPSPPFLAVASIRSHSPCRGCRSGSRCPQRVMLRSLAILTKILPRGAILGVRESLGNGPLEWQHTTTRKSTLRESGRPG